jgi:DNA-binding winged helix-turn-helix (wHTH) protein/tetratricopeptide (TPR) repeat protein
VLYRLAGFAVDIASLELRDADGQHVEISPLAFDLLVYLIEHRDRVVPKDELFDTLWGNVAVSPSSLSQGIWTVRRALRDTGGAQRVIKNVRGRGYRLVADVETVASRGTAPALGGSASSEKAATSRGERPTQPRVVAHEDDLVGRVVEIDRLRQALAKAVAGRGRICLLSGWPGMGKTRLAQELATIAGAQGVRVLEGRCFDGEGVPPFWPWQQIARGLIRQHPPEQLAALVGDGAGDLVKLIPELREGIPDLAGAPQRVLGQERFQLFDALRALLASAAEQKPLLLVIDDLHWADEPTLRFLEFLAPALERMHVLLLCTLRSSAANPVLEASVASALRRPSAALIELSGLPEDEVAALLALHEIAEPSPELVRRVFDLTAGNPFFVAQLARWLSAHPDAARGRDDQLKLPLEARAVLRQQIAAVPRACQELLQLGAVLGQGFHISDLRRASRLCASDVLARLEPALDGRIVREDAGDVGAFHFSHPTIRETLYEDLPRTARARLHRIAADAIAQTHADDPTSRLTELAHHYYEAAAGGSATEASRYCRLAAERAYDATAFEESVLHYRRALNALDLTDPIDERARCELLLGLGRSMRGTPVAVDEIRAVFAEAAARAASAGDAHMRCEAAMCHAGRGPMRVAVLREAGTVHGPEIELLQQALAALAAGDSSDRALAQAWLAYSLYNSERREQRKELARDAVAVARRVGDATVLAECLMLMQTAVRGPSDLDARLAMLDEIIELTRRSGVLGLQLDAYSERTWARWERGDLERAEADMHSVQRLAEESHQPREKRVAVQWRVMKLDAEGRFAEADALLNDMNAAFPLPPQGRVDQGKAIRQLMITTFRGKSQDMIGPLEAIAEKFPLPVAWHCGLVASYAGAGRLTDAARELNRLAAGDFACIPDDHNWLTSHSTLSSAVRVLGDAARARVLYEKLLPYADRNGVIGLHGFAGGVVHRPLGEFATVFGEYDAAERHFTRAIAENTRLGILTQVAWARLSYAEMLLKRSARGDQACAFEQLTTAISYARSRDLAALVERGESLREQGASKSLRGSA